jgi:hypothetical protein
VKHRLLGPAAILVVVLGLLVFAEDGTPPPRVEIHLDHPSVQAGQPIAGCAIATLKPPVTVRLLVDGIEEEVDRSVDPEDPGLNEFAFPTRPEMAGKTAQVVAVDNEGHTVSVNVQLH